MSQTILLHFSSLFFSGKNGKSLRRLNVIALNKFFGYSIPTSKKYPLLLFSL